MRFSQEQEQAIFTRGRSLLVSAAAGSGKTAVLIERILALLGEGESLEEMLIVTFTKAAAAEMRARLQTALTARADSEHLRAQRRAIPRAQIRTLHSFCEWLLRQHFQKADVPPAFRVDGGALLLPMRLRAMEEALDAALQRDMEALARLCDVDELEGIALRLHAFLRNQPDPAGFARLMLSRYDTLNDFPSSPYAAYLSERRDALLHQGIAILTEALRLCGGGEGGHPYAARLQQDITSLKDALSGGEPALLNLPRVGEEVDEGFKEQIQNMRKRVKEQCLKPLSELSELSGGEGVRRALAMKESLAALCRLTLEYDALYTRYKSESGILDFNDLEHRAIQALSDEQARMSVRQGFAHVFVDEYQDINAVQEAILSALSGRDNAFAVGDVKQSIYRFRLADPGIFLNTSERYLRGEGGRQIDLNRNYRSAPHILHAVNYIFRRAMRGGAAEILYDDKAALYPGRQEEDEDTAVDIVLVHPPEREDLPADDPADDPAVDARLIELEAHAAAEWIAGIAGEPIPDGEGGSRLARYGDIAILLRSPGGRQEYFIQALEALDIPVSADTGGTLYAAPEVAAFIEVLKAVDNRQRDVPLLGAMRAIGGFTSEDIALIRSAFPEGAFHQAAAAMTEREGDLALRTREFLECLLRWRYAARRMPLMDFLTMVLSESGLERRYMALPHEAPLANLRAFISKASAVDGATLGDFLFAAEQGLFADDGGGDGAMQPPSERNAVRILSVHKSKGLEFPIVIGAGLGTRFNLADTRDTVLMSRDLGIACRYRDEQMLSQADTPAYRAIAIEKRTQSLAEELRILYVLMTRARERLILFGSVPSPEKAARGWAMSGGEFLSAAQPLDWIAPALLAHPDGAALRQYLDGREIKTAQDESRFRLHIIPGFTRQLAPVRAGIESLFQRPAHIPPGLPPDVQAAIEYEYPLPSPDPLKTSVTASLRGHRYTALPPELPIFLRDALDLSPSQRGSAFHAVLRALEFSPLRGLSRNDALNEIRRQLGVMTERALLSARQAESVDTSAIADFIVSPLGGEALSAQTILREQPFNLRVGTSDTGDAVRLMQGIIDLAFLTPDNRWIVVDYKTDRAMLRPSDVQERHGDQLRQYGAALTSLTGLPVARLLVYLFANGQSVAVPYEEVPSE